MLEGEALPYDGDGYVTACTDAAVTTAPEQPRLAGVIQVNPDALPQQNDDPVMLDGDVAFAPDFRTDTVADKADYYAPIYQSMFSEHGITMNRCSRKTDWFDIGFYEELESVKDKTEVIFFDGSVSDQGVTMREWLSSLCTKHFDWGCLLEDHAPEVEFTRVIFVDVSADTEPAAVARDLGL